MTDSGPSERETGTAATSERLVLFTDAVAAIALTLLVLPLVDLVPEAAAHGDSLGELFVDHLSQFGAFVLSFALIARFWWAHHELFRHVGAIDRRVVRWNTLWTFAIVVLPLPTAIITAYAPSTATVALYGANLALATGSLAAIGLTLARHDELRSPGDPVPRRQIVGSVVTFGILVVALVIGCVFPRTINYLAYLLLLASDPIERVLLRRWVSSG